MKLRISAILLLALATVSVTPTTASAALINYEIDSISGGNSTYTFQFQLDTTRTPSFRTADTIRFAPTTIRYTLPGSSTVFTDTIGNLGPSFFAPINQGGISILRLPRGNDPQPRFFGPALFTGPTTNPTFLTGEFFLATTPRNVPSDIQVFNIRVRATDVTNAIPEPATWAMMIAGFGLTGAALRRRRTALAT